MAKTIMKTNGQIIIQGRPDMDNHKFGISRAKRHPKYVYGHASFGCLVHEIAYVEFRWYDIGPGGHCLIWRHHPKITATTRCGYNFFVRNYGAKKQATVCEMPKPDAVMCGRCQGEGPVFPRNKKWGVTKTEAKARLGCTDIIQVGERE